MHNDDLPSKEAVSQVSDGTTLRAPKPCRGAAAFAAIKLRIEKRQEEDRANGIEEPRMVRVPGRAYFATEQQAADLNWKGRAKW